MISYRSLCYFLFRAALFLIGSYYSYSFLWPPIGAGAIHVLLTAHKIQSKCPAAARVGINPTPTEAECCNHFDNPLIVKVLHASAVGTGFIPVLPTADKIQSKYPAASRVGINPTPTKCCNHLDNPLIAKVLHASAVGVGFIPVLPTADKIQSKYPAAGRTGINPVPTAAECCKCFIISVLDRILGQGSGCHQSTGVRLWILCGGGSRGPTPTNKPYCCLPLVVDCNYGLLSACRLCGNVKVFRRIVLLMCLCYYLIIIIPKHLITARKAVHFCSRNGPFCVLNEAFRNAKWYVTD